MLAIGGCGTSKDKDNSTKKDNKDKPGATATESKSKVKTYSKEEFKSMNDKTIDELYKILKKYNCECRKTTGEKGKGIRANESKVGDITISGFEFNYKIDGEKISTKCTFEFHEKLDGKFDMNKVEIVKELVTTLTGKKDYDFNAMNDNLNKSIGQLDNAINEPKIQSFDNLSETIVVDTDKDKNEKNFGYILDSKDIVIK